MISIRGGSGLGDALYLQSVARYLVNEGATVEACTDWHAPFKPLGKRVMTSQFRRQNVDRLAHYATRRGAPDTTQWEDVCITAGIPTTAPLQLDWTVGGEIAPRVKATAGSRPLVLVQMPRAPFARSDGYGKELLPKCGRIQDAIDLMAPRAFVVQIGMGRPTYKFERLDLDLVNHTSVSDLIDLASLADACLGFVSFIVPLAESLNKPALLIWSRRGLSAKEEPVRQITPQKIFHRHGLCNAVFDDCSTAELQSAVDTLCGSIGSRAAA